MEKNSVLSCGGFFPWLEMFFGANPHFACQSNVIIKIIMGKYENHQIRR